MCMFSLKAKLSLSLRVKEEEEAEPMRKRGHRTRKASSQEPPTKKSVTAPETPGHDDDPDRIDDVVYRQRGNGEDMVKEWWDSYMGPELELRLR